MIIHFSTNFYIIDFFFVVVTLALGFLCTRLLSAVGPCDHLALLPATMSSCLLSPVKDKE